jgi:hypothetical protein
VLIYWLWNWERLEVFKMLLASFFPLALLILAVLGSIVVGLGDAGRGGGRGRVRRLHPRRGLPIHLPLAREAAERRRPPGR